MRAAVTKHPTEIRESRIVYVEFNDFLRDCNDLLFSSPVLQRICHRAAIVNCSDIQNMIIGPSFRDLVLGIEDGTMSLQNLNELLGVATPSLQ